MIKCKYYISFKKMHSAENDTNKKRMWGEKTGE